MMKLYIFFVKVLIWNKKLDVYLWYLFFVFLCIIYENVIIVYMYVYIKLINWVI